MAWALRHRGRAGRRFREALPPIGMQSAESPRAHPFVATRKTAMAEDMEKVSRESPVQAKEKADIAIFCCAVIGVVVIVIAMVKGVFS